MPRPNNSHLAQVGSGTTTPLPTNIPSGLTDEYPVGQLATSDGYILDGKTRLVAVTPVISTAIYAVGDQLGDLLTFASILPDADIGGTIVSVAIIDKAGTNSAMDLFIYDRSVTLAADNAAAATSDADALFCLGAIGFSGGHYVAPGANAVATRSGVGIAVKANAAGHLYGQLVVRAAPTYGSTSDLKVVLAVKAD